MKGLEEQKFYCLNKDIGKTEGPYTLAELERLLSDGLLTDEVPVSARGAAQWASLRKVIESKGSVIYRVESKRGFFGRLFSKK